jgi:hypothetical protein
MRRGSFLLQISESFVANKDGNLLDLRLEPRSGTFWNAMENHTRERVRAICCIAVSFDRKLIISSLAGTSRVRIPLSWRSIQEATRNEWLAATQSRKRFSEIALQNVWKSSLMPKPTYEGHEQQRINAGRLKHIRAKCTYA